MNVRGCDACLFYDTCPTQERKGGCAYFSPITDESEDYATEAYIEKNRRDFARDWRMYINSVDDETYIRHTAFVFDKTVYRPCD